jgi:PDZ domain-containing protein
MALCEAREHDLSCSAGYGVGIVGHPISEPPRRGRARVAGLMILVVIIGLVIWSNKHLSNEFAITPGLAQPVGPLISVSDHPHSAARQTIMLTDVYLTQLTTWQWLIDQIHPPAHEEFISLSMLTDFPASQLTAQAYLQMFDSKSFAKVAAMRALGLHVGGTPIGATVYGFPTDSPAASVLSVGDRVVAAQGMPIRNECDLVRAASRVGPGQRLSLMVQHVRISGTGVFGYMPPTSVEVHVASVPADAGQSRCPGNPSLVASYPLGTPLAPMFLEDATRWHFPVSVSIKTPSIGGPSAGLAMTLGVIDALSKTSITGTLKIAATGEIDQYGNVLDVGGVAEKTIAVENAGATVFLVPTQEFGVARSAASGGLKVIEVATLGQALRAIERLSGVTPVPITG